jgi:hypothetical protein
VTSLIDAPSQGSRSNLNEAAEISTGRSTVSRPPPDVLRRSSRRVALIVGGHHIFVFLLSACFGDLSYLTLIAPSDSGPPPSLPYEGLSFTPSSLLFGPHLFHDSPFETPLTTAVDISIALSCVPTLMSHASHCGGEGSRRFCYFKGAGEHQHTLLIGINVRHGSDSRRYGAVRHWGMDLGISVDT